MVGHVACPTCGFIKPVARKEVSFEESPTPYATLTLHEATGSVNVWADANGDQTFPGTPAFLGAEGLHNTTMSLDHRYDSVGLLWHGKIKMDQTARDQGAPFQVSSIIGDVSHQAFKAFGWDANAGHPSFVAIRDALGYEAPSSTWAE